MFAGIEYANSIGISSEDFYNVGDEGKFHKWK